MIIIAIIVIITAVLKTNDKMYLAKQNLQTIYFIMQEKSIFQWMLITFMNQLLAMPLQFKQHSN